MAQMEEPVSPAATPQDFARRNAPHGDGAGAGVSNLFRSAARNVKNKAREAAEKQKSVGVERIDAIGRAVHGAADELGREIPQAAFYVLSAADTLQNASRKLNERSVDDLLWRLDRFARKQPGIALAGSVVAGLALSRFLKSSDH